MGSPLSVATPGPALPAVTAEAFVVADLDTGAVFAAKDPHAKHAPASTMKMLTAVTMIPRIPTDTMLTPSFHDIAVDGTKVGLVNGTAYPYLQVLQGMLMVSGNDAARTLASWSGDTETTLGWMNDQARYLHAGDTVAMTPSGLDAPGQSSSAYDLALIARAGMHIPLFAQTVGTLRSHISTPSGGEFAIYSHTKLLTKYPGSLGIKGGYTIAARASFACAAARDGHRVLATVMGVQTGPLSQTECAQLMDYGFAAEAADVTPVARLVTPGEPKPVDLTTRSPSALAAASAATSDGSGISPLGPLVGVLALLVVVAVGSLRLRAVRRGQRRRESLRQDGIAYW